MTRSRAPEARRRRPAMLVAQAVLVAGGLAIGLAIAEFAQPRADLPTPADDALRARVDSALALHRSLYPFAIAVSVEDGRVRLDGSVDAPAERELATRVARSIDGVRDIDNALQIEPDRARWLTARVAVGDRLDDGLLAMTIRAHLRWHRATRAMALDVDAWQGTVVLRGRASSAREREAAARLAANVAGVQAVDNRITVDERLAARSRAWFGGLGAGIGDAWISLKVRAALLLAADSGGWDLHVLTHDGEVRLRGIAASRSELDLATEIAAGVRGVQRVDVDAVRVGG